MSSAALPSRRGPWEARLAGAFRRGGDPFRLPLGSRAGLALEFGPGLELGLPLWTGLGVGLGPGFVGARVDRVNPRVCGPGPARGGRVRPPSRPAPRRRGGRAPKGWRCRLFSCRRLGGRSGVRRSTSRTALRYGERGRGRARPRVPGLPRGAPCAKGADGEGPPPPPSGRRTPRRPAPRRNALPRKSTSVDGAVRGQGSEHERSRPRASTPAPTPLRPSRRAMKGLPRRGLRGRLRPPTHVPASAPLEP